MGTTTKLSFEGFQKLQENADNTVRYELDEGELLTTPSPTAWHNVVRYRLRRALTDFVQANSLGLVLDETDFRLDSLTVRKPDIAYLNKQRMTSIDVHRWPIEGAPSLAIEEISPSNLMQDTTKKIHQYKASGTEAVWLIYPDLRLIQIHDSDGLREVVEPQSIEEHQLFAGSRFAMSLAVLFDENLER